ncbi:hypothetical protein BDV93DRAFT_556420 [Ceratobasidium sp. AG-I]|nr:hypothetical protein BDV93DRAFT_556420 [Ceratobasidium sp. AG-I]
MPLDMVTILSIVVPGYSISENWFSRRWLRIIDPSIPSSQHPLSCRDGTSSLLDLEWLDNLIMDVNLGLFSSPLLSFSEPANLGQLDCLSLSPTTHGHEIPPGGTHEVLINLPPASDFAPDASHFGEPILTTDAPTLPQSLNFPPLPELYELAETDYISTQPLNVSSNTQAGILGFVPNSFGLGGGADDWHSTEIDPGLPNSIFPTHSPLPINLDWFYSSTGLYLDLFEPLTYPSGAGESSAPTVVSTFLHGNDDSASLSETTQVNNLKRIVCEYCAKPFIRSSAYKEHINMHLGRKPHHCPSCDKPFSVRSNMLRHHRKKHPGDKNLHQAPKPTEEQGTIESPGTSVFRERSYKDSGYGVYRLGGYGKSDRPTNDGVGPTRQVRSYARRDLEAHKPRNSRR